MKRFIILLTICLSVLFASSQVEQLIYLKNGQFSRVEYIGQDQESMFVLQEGTKDKISLQKEEIQKVQTLGIHHLSDNFDRFLSNSNKTLEYRDVGKTVLYDLHLSGRTRNDTILFLIKLKFERKYDKEERMRLFTGDIMRFILEGGDQISLSFQNTYLLDKYILYNIGYLLPSHEDIQKFINHPVEEIYIRDQKVKVKDKYCFMRQTLGLLDY